MNPFMTWLTSPKVKGAITVPIAIFLAAALNKLSPLIDGGVPPESQWRGMLVSGGFAGLVALVHYYMTSPANAAAVAAARSGTPRGFAYVRTMMAAVVLSGCAAAIAAIVPSASLVACAVKAAKDNPGLSFEQYCLAAWKTCGGTIEAIVEAIVQSGDPAVAAYKDAAQAAKGDPVKMKALKGYVAAHQVTP